MSDYTLILDVDNSKHIHNWIKTAPIFVNEC
jgi:hypothetical protein